MIENSDTMELLTPLEWIERAKSTSINKRRKVVLDYWVKANGFKDAEEGVSIVRQNGKLYSSFDKAVKAIIDGKSAFSTIETYRKTYRLFIDNLHHADRQPGFRAYSQTCTRANRQRT